MTVCVRMLIVAGCLLGVCATLHADIVCDMITIGNPGNAADTPYMDTSFHIGAVSYVYQISTYEVTVGQYTEFLNAKAASDPYDLYHPDMESGYLVGGSFILRSGESGSYTYTAVSGKENQPVRMVSFFDSLRFCNWLHNGQGAGDTEAGSYTISDGVWLLRNEGASWVLPSLDEWFKAAYYDAEAEEYRQYPNGRDAIEYPTDETTPREQNFGGSQYEWYGNVCFTSTGETTGQSAYGVCDMGGNVREWTDTLNPPGNGFYRKVRGGSFSSLASSLSRPGEVSENPDLSSEGLGFRLVYLIPEPGTVGLLVVGMMGICYMRRRKSSG